MKVAIHADGGSGIGLGHAMRCLGLAEALRAEGAEVLFISVADVEDLVSRYGFGFRPVLPDGPALVEAVRAEDVELLVLDSYRLLPAAVAGAVPRLAALDDRGSHALPVDFAINAVMTADPACYGRRGAARALLGPRYQIIRPGIPRISARGNQRPALRLLVTYGGADGLGVGSALLALLRDRVLPALPGLEVDFVVGPFAEEPQGPWPPGVRRLKASDLGTLMPDADLALCAAGLTVYELAHAGVPMVVFGLSADQADNLTAFQQAGLALVGGWFGEEGWAERVAGATLALARDGEARSSQAAMAARLIDGQGARRIARALLGREEEDSP